MAEKEHELVVVYLDITENFPADSSSSFSQNFLLHKNSNI